MMKSDSDCPSCKPTGDSESVNRLVDEIVKDGYRPSFDEILKRIGLELELDDDEPKGKV
jgi:hypothetical protein